MRICLVNPNSTESMNMAILQSARRAAVVSGRHVELECRSVRESPALINSDAEEVEAAYWTLQEVRRIRDYFDAFVIACHSDPCLGAAAEVTGKPVFGIGSSSLLAAAEITELSAILVISEKSVPRKQAFARRLGLTRRFISIPTGYTEEMDDGETLECLGRAAEAAVGERGAGALVLGCAGMGSAAVGLRKRFHVPVIDGTEEAVRLAVRALAG